MPQDSELIVSGKEEKCNYLQLGQFRMHKEGVILRVCSLDPNRLLVPSSFRQEV